MKLGNRASVLGLLTFGTACSLLAKLIYYVEGESQHGGIRQFEKPWFSVLVMFAGMSFCVVLDLPRKKSRVSTGMAMSSGETVPLAPASKAVAADASTAKAPSVWIINIPTIFDLFATACGTTGLLYTSVSVYQMLRGAQLVFTALMSVVFLKSKLTMYNYAGILLCLTGIALVGFANIWSAGGNATEQANQTFGVLIILLGQVMQAAQVVVEEYLLTGMRMSSVRIVAYEGIFGVMHMLLWVLPVAYFLPGSDFGRLEDTPDSFYMLIRTGGVMAVLISDMCFMLCYNVCAMGVTENLSAIHRVVIETLRTLFVWIIDLFCYYAITHGGFGEAWTKYSFLQLLGFALLIAGTVTYNYSVLAVEYFPSRKRTTSAAVAPPQPATAPSSGTLPVALADGITAVVAGDEEEYDDDVEEDEDEEEELASSFMSQPFGSPSHSSYLALGATPKNY